MAPLATAFVLVLPNMAAFPAAAAAGIRSTNLAAAGAAQGAAFGTSFAKNASKLMAAGVVVGLGVLLKDSVKAAGDFEAQMVRLVTSAGETGTLVSGNLKIVAQGILDMAGPVGTTVEALGKAMYTVESGSFHGAEALKVLRAAAEGAKAENADLTKVTNAVTTALVDYHLSADQSAFVTTKLVAATAAGKTTFEEMTGALHSVLPQASAAHISLENILGSLAAMTLHGISAEQATQNLAHTIGSLQGGSAIAAKELALLGFTTQQIATDLKEKGLSGTLQEISDRIRMLMPPGSDKVILQLGTALNTLSPEVRNLGMQLIDGSISFIQYRTAARDLTPIQAQQAMSFAALAGATHRIGDEQLSGAQVMQTYATALKKATGDQTGMNVALMLTGDNAAQTNNAIKMVTDATTEAGNHVKGWAEIQETFNFKLAAMKASLGVVAVAIGETLLPPLGELFDKITEILGPMAEWITDHETLTTIIAGSVSGLLALGTAALIVTKLTTALKLLATTLKITAAAQWILNAAVGTTFVVTSLAEAQIAAYLFWSRLVQVATKVWTATQWALNAAWTFFTAPITLVILAIAALVAGVVYAYFHFDGFRKFVDKLWQSLQQTAKVIWSALVTAFHAVGDAAVWLWEHAIGPAFRFIMGMVKAWWEYAQFVFGLFKTAIEAVGAAATWLYQNVFHPVFTAIQFVVHAWWVIIQVIFAAFKLYLTEIVGPAVMWLWHSVIEPAWHGIQFAIALAWTIMKGIFDAIMTAVHAVGDAAVWLWHTIIEPAWNGIRLAVAVAWAQIKGIFDAIVGFVTGTLGPIFVALWHQYLEPAWNGIKLLISLAWSGVIKPAFDAMVKFVTETIPEGFRKGVDLIGRIWDGLKAIVAAPINAVIRFVLNDGIIKAWNTLAGWVGLPKDQRIPNIDEVKFADGGQVQKFAAGGSIRGIGGPREDNIPILASAGEYVIPAHVVNDIGVGWFDGLIGKKPMRAGDGSSGIAIGRFADGGLIGAIMDPAGWVGDQVNGMIDKVPGAGIVRDIGIGAAKKLITGLIDWVKSKVAGMFGANASALTVLPGGLVPWLYAQHGKPYGWAQAGPNSYDCSGIVSAVWNILHGQSPYRHTFSTMNEAPFFPKVGQWGLFTAGWANPGERGGGSVGHTAAKLGGPLGIGVESTGSRGVRIGVGTTSPTSFAHFGTFDRGGPWPNNTYGLNTSGRTEHVFTGDAMDALLAEVRGLRRDVQAVAPGVGQELTGAARGMRQAARTRA